MYQGSKPRTKAIGVFLLLAAACGAPVAAQQATGVGSSSTVEPAAWQGPELSAQTAAKPTGNESARNPLRVALQPAPPTPPQNVHVTPADPFTPSAQPNTLVPPSNPTPTAPSPLLDGNSPTEDLMPPVVEGCDQTGEHEGVRPYGGGHPTDWSWGCGGSPYRQGPGICDNYKVGPRWHWTFDGLVMSRDATDLTALANRMFTNDPTGIAGTPLLENFEYGPGGRITFTSQVPRYIGYQIQSAYEGIINWDAAIVYPKTSPADVLAPAVPPSILNSTQQRSLHYTSDYNSGEISWVRSCDENWHPFCGVRYIQLAERLDDVLNQQSPFPLPGSPPPGPFTVTDRKNLFDIDNRMFGFQVGMLHEAWCITRRCTIEGFVNGGVYYNRIDYFNKMSTHTTQQIGDNLSTVAVDESRIDFSDNTNNDKSQLNEIAYVAEASLSGVCRLNKCWAMRAGYQVLWIDHVHLADAAFLGNAQQSDELIFHGWHAGIECRR